MWTTILNFLTPIILWLINTFVKSQQEKAEKIGSYYEFLNQIDKQSAAKVANYIASENALSELQNQIREKQLIEPERENAKMIVKSYDIPEIKEVDVDVKTQGKYLTKNKQAKGLVVHYTAGRFDEGEKSAVSTLKYLAREGLGCLVMDVDGHIYKARNQGLDDIAWHAGKSFWMGYEGISRYCMGIEICNAGLLDDKNTSWFGQKIPANKVRHIAQKTANQQKGKYHMFTKAQEESLMNFCMWQLDTNPEFSVEWVVGHDEIAPERKQDPGGSLSMTMPDFRAFLWKKLSENK